MGGLPDETEEPWWGLRLDAQDEIEFLPKAARSTETDLCHPLLLPLSQAQNGIARLEASVATASPAVAEGICARTSYGEAAGWLAHVSTWIHPNDLALRDSGLTGSYLAVAPSGVLQTHLPSKGAMDTTPELLFLEQNIAAALRLARHWRRLAEFKTWRPLADAVAVRETVDSLAWRRGPIQDSDIEAWLAPVLRRHEVPELISAGRAARDWMNTHIESDPLAIEATFLAACVWREKGFGRSISLPFWSATAYQHHRLTSAVGIPWLVGFLECITEATQAVRYELDRLRRTEERGATITRSARSYLPAAIDAVIRVPIITARSLAKRLAITHQAALGLLKQLVESGIIKEATGRSAWRAFVTM
jgi:ribosomal protein S25